MTCQHFTTIAFFSWATANQIIILMEWRWSSSPKRCWNFKYSLQMSHNQNPHGKKREKPLSLDVGLFIWILAHKSKWDWLDHVWLPVACQHKSPSVTLKPTICHHSLNTALLKTDRCKSGWKLLGKFMICNVNVTLALDRFTFLSLPSLYWHSKD